MESLTELCAHKYVELGRVLSFESQLQRSPEFHSKENDLSNELANTPLSSGIFEERVNNV